VRSTFAAEEQRFSRFRPGSELTRVNAAAGTWTPVSPAFRSLLHRALGYAATTGGLFDPTVLRALEAAGYDGDFDEVVRGARDRLRPPVPCGRWEEIEIRGNTVRLPDGAGLDLGGIAKGATVDLAVERIVSSVLPWVVVSAGGDLRVAGNAPTLAIDVEDPATSGTALLTLRLAHGALATSSTAKRSWGSGLHHVIDPRTGAPAETDAVQVTTWAPTCADAEVRAKVGLLVGAAAAGERPSVVVERDGTMIVSFRPDPSAPTEEAA
jgi:thiamine biosynthesis lipoprotein